MMDLNFPTSLNLNALIYERAMPVVNDVVSKAFSGDVTTIALLGIGIIVCFVLLVLLVEVATWLIGLVKRFLLFLIVAVSTALFFFSFQDKIFVPQPDIVLVASGVVGIAFAIIALAISIISIKREWQTPKEAKIADLKSEMKELVAQQFESELEGRAVKAARPQITPTQVQAPQLLTKQALTPRSILASFQDRSLLAVLSYMVVAEFGVISGVTISAPNEQVGLLFFAMFLIAALLFIKSTYHNYLTGLKHLFAALLIGATLSVILSNVWLNVPVEQLLSMAYFKTNALVALVTGLAVSLFMGSKG